MAAKKVDLASLAAQLDKMNARMERGFAAVAGDIADIRKEMATKKDIVKINETLAEHTAILEDHTRDLNIIKNDVKTNLDKRLTLEVRVTNIEKKVFGASQEPAHQ